MSDHSPNVPKVPKEDPETPENTDSTSPVEIVDLPAPSDLEISHGPGTLIAPGEAMPIYSISRLKAAMAANDITPEFLVERLALFISHPNPSYSLGAMRLLCSHISDVLKINGITVSASPPKKEPTNGQEDLNEDPQSPPVPEEGHRISGTRLALDRHSVDGDHPWATLRRSTSPDPQSG